MSELVVADLAYNLPDSAAVGDPFIVELRLSKRLGGDELARLIEHPGTMHPHRVRISNRAVATLSGGSAFDVSPASGSEQLVPSDGTAGWLWQVTPKASGSQYLTLSLAVPLDLDGRQSTITAFQRETPLSVGIRWPRTLTGWIASLKEGGTLWTAVMLPLGALMLSRFWKTVMLPLGAFVLSRFWPRDRQHSVDRPNPQGHKRRSRPSDTRR